MPRITAAICTYDRYPLLEQAIESLRGQTLPASDFRILIVDNSPDHAAARRFGERFAALPNLDYLVEERPGIANARNVAIRACDSEFIAFMDDDAIADPGWAAALVAAFEAAGPQAVALGGRIDPLWETPRPSWLSDGLLGYLSLVDLGGELRETPDVDWIAGCNMALRVSALPADSFAVALGRQGNAGILLSNEELELARRLQAAGGRVFYAPEARVDHLVSARRVTHAWFRQRVVWQAISDYVMNPQQSAETARRHWRAVQRYLRRPLISFRRSTVEDLGEDTPDPERFNRQLWALTVLTHMQLCGFTALGPALPKAPANRSGQQ